MLTCPSVHHSLPLAPRCSASSPEQTACLLSAYVQLAMCQRTSGAVHREAMLVTSFIYRLIYLPARDEHVNQKAGSGHGDGSSQTVRNPWLVCANVQLKLGDPGGSSALDAVNGAREGCSPAPESGSGRLVTAEPQSRRSL